MTHYFVFVILLIGSLGAADFNNSTGDLLYEDQAGNTLPYRLFLPQGYDPSVKYPLVVFYHGAGQRGTENTSPSGGHTTNLYNATQGSLSDNYKALLLVPQCPNEQRWVEFNWAQVSYTDAQEPSPGQAMTLSLAILDQVVATYPVDHNRIYITGLSMGGIGTWDVIRHRPFRVTAAMPLSGGGNREQGPLISSIPIWAYHGDSDTVVPTRGTDQMNEAITAAGGSIHYSRPTGIRHSGWGTFYDNSTYRNDYGETTMEWLFSQTGNDPSTVIANRNTAPADATSSTTICVSLRNASNLPIIGKTVTLTSSRGSLDQISPASGPSDAQGRTTFTVTSSTLGLAVFTATNSTDSRTLAKTVAIDFTVTLDYGSWQNSFPNFTPNLPEQDADKDGLSNQFEYAFGLDPTSANVSSPIVTSLDHTNTFTYQRRDPALTGLTYIVWLSSDLTTWTAAPQEAQSSTPTDSSQIQQVTVTLENLSTTQNLYYRIGVN